jgi:hypothetical protein
VKPENVIPVALLLYFLKQALAELYSHRKKKNEPPEQLFAIETCTAYWTFVALHKTQ